MTSTIITVQTLVHAPVAKVWNIWNDPKHIINWNTPTPDWHTPRSTNDLVVGGKITCRMEAKDGSFGFDFEGTYDQIKTNEFISYTIADGRKVQIVFTSKGNDTLIEESFEAESENPVDMQRSGWQAIMDSFKKYTESLN